MDENNDIRKLSEKLGNCFDLEERLSIDKVGLNELKNLMNTSNQFTISLLSYTGNKKNIDELKLEKTIEEYLSGIIMNIATIKRYIPYFDCLVENIYTNIEKIRINLKEYKKEEKTYKKETSKNIDVPFDWNAAPRA